MRNILVSILFLCSLSLSAQIDSLLPTEEIMEEEIYVYRKNVDSLFQTQNIQTNQRLYPSSFEEDFQEKYTGNDFDYDITKPTLSIRERIKRIINSIFHKIFWSEGLRKINTFTQVVFIFLSLVVFIIVVYFVMKILRKKEGNWFFSKKNKSVLPEESDWEEDIHEINFPQTILECEQKGDYRLAIRYRFLSVLKTLTDQEKIQWHQQKTNSDYIKELENPQEKEAFKQIAYIFDYVWYGEFPIDNEKYKSVLPKFERLKNRVYE